MPLETIDQVLAELDDILAICRRRGSDDGYFAAMYRRVTAEVQRRIEQGYFADGPRMVQFDVQFAQRFLDAWRLHERGGEATAVWRLSFAAAHTYWPVVLQHLLLGMNAHINLDLGLVAASVAPGPAIHGLKHDFDRINAVLAEQVDDMQDRLAAVWPAFRWLDRMSSADEAVINFSIRRARDHAWSMAMKLAAETDVARSDQLIRNLDTSMAALGRRVLRPGARCSLVLAAIRVRERGSVAEKIDVLLR
jgi:hypothetical protein